MPADEPSNLSRIRLLAFAGASTGMAVVLIAAWTLFVHDVEPALATLAIPALAGPILQPGSPSGVFSRYILIGACASTAAILLGLLLGQF